MAWCPWCKREAEWGQTLWVRVWEVMSVSPRMSAYFSEEEVVFSGGRRQWTEKSLGAFFPVSSTVQGEEFLSTRLWQAQFLTPIPFDLMNDSFIWGVIKSSSGSWIDHRKTTGIYHWNNRFLSYVNYHLISCISVMKSCFLWFKLLNFIHPRHVQH